eukprot:2417887-Prymnesium_polylepis.1
MECTSSEFALFFVSRESLRERATASTSVDWASAISSGSRQMVSTWASDAKLMASLALNSAAAARAAGARKQDESSAQY